jgi:hypothetical protein
VANHSPVAHLVKLVAVEQAHQVVVERAGEAVENLGAPGAVGSFKEGFVTHRQAERR